MSIVLAKLRDWCAESPILALHARRLRVLLVEDSEADRVRLQRLLEDLLEDRVEVVHAVSCVAAVEASEGADLVLLDLQLEDGEGEDALSRLWSRQGPDFAGVVGVTNFATEAKASQLIRLGAHDFIRKDQLEPERLVRAMEVSLELARSRRATRKTIASLEATNTKLRAEIERRSRFVAQVAHDLRNPIQAVGLTAADLASTTVDPMARDAGVLLGAASRRLSRLVESLNNVRLLEMGQFDIELGRVNLRRTVRSVLDELRTYPRGELMTVTIRRIEEPVLMLDQDRLEQILINLCVNAMKFATSWVEADVSVEEGQVVITVSDDGQGVAVADRERIFEAYQQGAQVEGRSSGMGLGLSIARALAEAMGGTLTLEPSETGALFRLCLPARAPGDGKEGRKTTGEQC